MLPYLATFIVSLTWGIQVSDDHLNYTVLHSPNGLKFHNAIEYCNDSQAYSFDLMRLRQ